MLVKYLHLMICFDGGFSWAEDITDFVKQELIKLRRRKEIPRSSVECISQPTTSLATKKPILTYKQVSV